MFRKIDMFVFWLGISFNIIVLFLGALLVFLGKLNPNQVKYYGTIIFYAIIFFYKLKDKLFKIKYFFVYVFVSYILGEAIGYVSNFLVVTLSNIGIKQTFSFILVVVVLNCYLEGFLYQTFKKISHEKDNLIE